MADLRGGDATRKTSQRKQKPTAALGFYTNIR
jgi:hypothetical protein